MKIVVSIIFIAIIYLVYTMKQPIANNIEDSSPLDIIYEDSEPRITNVQKHSVTLQWQSQEKEIGAIEYGIMKEIYYKSRTDIQATHNHEILLDFLDECTKYYYHISSESMIFDNENNSFTTLCDNAKIPNKLHKDKEDINE